MAAKEWHLFTVAQTNAVVATIEPMLGRMTTAARRLAMAKARLDELTEAMRANGSGREAAALQEEIEDLVSELHDVVGALEEAGVEVKDVEGGIVDFPARHQGRVVLLCYRPGEGEVRCWHEVDDGFAGRQPIATLDDETLGRDGRGTVQPDR